MKYFVYIFLLLHTTVAFAQQLYPFPQNGKWGYIDQNGRTIVQPKYYSGGYFVDGVAKVSIIDDKGEYLYGFIDISGKEIIPPRFTSVSDFSDGVARIRIRDSYFFLLKNGSALTTQPFDEIQPATNGMSVFKRNDKYGYANSTGKVVIEEIFTDARPFSDSGVAVVSIDERRRAYGVINTSGEFIVEPKYQEIKDFVGGLSAVRNGRSWVIIDKNGNLVSNDKFDDVGELSNGLINVKKGNWGFIDSLGDMLIPTKFKFADKFSNGLAIVSDGKLYSYINTSGELITPYSFTRVTRFDGKLARVSQGDKNGFMNVAGRFNLTDKISSLGSFFSGRARMRVDNFYGYYSSDAKLAVKPMYLYASEFRDNLALTVAPMTGGYKIAYINVNGNTVKSWNVLYQPILKNKDVFYTIVYPSIPFYKESDPESNIIIRVNYGGEFIKTHQNTATPINGHGLSGMLYSAEHYARPGYIFSEVISRYSPPKIGMGLSSYFRESVGVIYETGSPTSFTPMSAVFFNGATLNRTVNRTAVEDKYFIPFMKVSESLFLFAAAMGYPISEYPRSGSLPNFLSNPETARFSGQFSGDTPTGYTLTIGRERVRVTEGKFGINVSYVYTAPNVTVDEAKEPIFSSDAKYVEEEILIDTEALEDQYMITNVEPEETIIIEEVQVTNTIVEEVVEVTDNIIQNNE